MGLPCTNETAGGVVMYIHAGEEVRPTIPIKWAAHVTKVGSGRPFREPGIQLGATLFSGEGNPAVADKGQGIWHGRRSVSMTGHVGAAPFQMNGKTS
jgi:hypothetical protein